ncbi:MAG: RusA family crossover junction endodeoxyribonuclease [Sedimentisphaerales bacterium]|nr:RusA family crossover junction endodeoxyribonuclease [Sedimentisphaerales bacterium]
MKMTLPWPPSLNNYYRRVGPRTLISKSGRQYRRKICELLGGNGPRKPPSDGRIALCMDAFPPDRRKRDLDNLHKALADSLAHAGVYRDDSQIDLLLTQRREVVTGGKLMLQILDLPLRRCPLCGNPLTSNERIHPHDN